MLMVKNSPGDAALYDLESGDRLTEFRVTGALSLAQFSLDGNRLLLVLPSLPYCADSPP